MFLICSLLAGHLSNFLAMRVSQKLKLQVIPPLSELYVVLPNIPIPAYRNILIEVAKLSNILFTILYLHKVIICINFAINDSI